MGTEVDAAGDNIDSEDSDIDPNEMLEEYSSFGDESSDLDSDADC